MIILALLVLVGIAIALRVALPQRFVRLCWYVASGCLLVAITSASIIAYAVNFDKRFFLSFPLHPYYLALTAFIFLVLFLGIVLGIVGKRRRAP